MPGTRVPLPQHRLQCPPRPTTEGQDDELRALGIDVLRFTADEVFASFAAAEHVLDHVRTRWGWDVLEQLAGSSTH